MIISKNELQRVKLNLEIRTTCCPSRTAADEKERETK